MEKFSNFDTRCCVAQSINAFETIFVFSFGPHKKKITPKWHIWLLVNGWAKLSCFLICELFSTVVKQTQAASETHDNSSLEDGEENEKAS